jgi:hypothetical protein
MKPLTNTQINRIKIKDLVIAIQQEIDPNRGMSLYLLEILDKIESSALQNATDDDLRRVEKLFIRYKLKINYYPSQNRKTIDVNGTSKIVPIDYVYGSKNS